MTKKDELREEAEQVIVKMLMETWYSSLEGSHQKANQILMYLEEAGWRVPKVKREEKQNQVS